MLDPDELDHLKFPVVVNIMEKLEGDVSDADLYNAGWNMTTIRIDSLQDVPKGYASVPCMTMKIPTNGNRTFECEARLNLSGLRATNPLPDLRLLR